MSPVTDIKVVGVARDVRTPDRAEVRLQVSKWGRDWDSIHRSVTHATDTVVEALKRLSAMYPQALFDHTISQISQRTWTDDIGSAYSETIEVAAVFTDFQVMSQWLFAQSPDLMHIHSIEWVLSPDAKNEVNTLLIMDAIRDARRKAESLAAAAGLTITGLQTLADSVTTDPEPIPGPIGPAAATGSLHIEREIDINLVPIGTSIRVDAHYLAEPDPTGFATTRRVKPAFMA